MRFINAKSLILFWASGTNSDSLYYYLDAVLLVDFLGIESALPLLFAELPFTISHTDGLRGPKLINFNNYYKTKLTILL